MDVAHLEPGLVHELGQILGHFLGQHGDQDALALSRAGVAFGDHIVDLMGGRADDALRIDQTGRPHHLFDENAAGTLQLPAARRRRDVNGLRPHFLPFLELKGAVVDAGRQTEPEIGERRFAREVAFEHGPDLRHGDMAFVDEQQGVFRQILKQSRRWLAGRPTGQIARIVLDPGAGTGRLHHLHIKGGALLETLSLQQLIVLVQVVEPQLELFLDALDRLAQRRFRGHVVGIGKHPDAFQIGRAFAGQGIEFVHRLQLVAEKRQTPGAVFQMRRKNLQAVPAPAKGAAMKAGVIALVLKFDQAAGQILQVDTLSDRQFEDHTAIGFNRTNTVNARHRGDDDHIVPLQQGAGGGMAHAIDLLVDGGFFFDIGVGARHIGLGLVVVVVRNEILHRVVREKAFHLAVKLRRQGLVGRQNQRRAAQFLDHMGDGEGFARAGDAQQHLIHLTLAHPADQFPNGRRLVAGGREVGNDFKRPAAVLRGRVGL